MQEARRAAPAESRPGYRFLTLGAGELSSRLIAFLGTIYLARQLGAEMYGVIGFGFAVLLYATIVADCGLEHTGPREVVVSRDALPTFLGSVLVVRIVAATVMAVLQLSMAAVMPNPERGVLAMYAIALIPVGFNLRWAHLGLERAGLVSLSRLLAEGLKLSLIVALVRGPSDVLLVPAAQLAGDTMGAMVLLWSLYRRGEISLRRIQIAPGLGAVRRALPMLANATLAAVIYNSDLIFLRFFRDASEVGRFLAAYTILNFVGILGHLLSLSLMPELTRLRPATGRRTELLQRSVVAATALGLPIAAGAALTAPLIVAFAFGPEYSSSAPALALLVWSFPFLLYRSVMQAALVSAEHIGDVVKTTGIAALSNVALNFIAIPLLGMMGAAITTVLAELVRAYSARKYARRDGFVPPNAVRYGRAVGSLAVMIVVLVAVRPDNLWVAVGLASATYSLMLVLSGGIRIRRRGVELSM